MVKPLKPSYDIDPVPYLRYPVHMWRESFEGYNVALSLEAPLHSSPTSAVIVVLQVRNVLKDHVPRLVGADNSEDLKIKNAEVLILEPRLIPSLRERLAGETSTQYVMTRNFRGIHLAKVANCWHLKVPLIQVPKIIINLGSEDTIMAEVP
jgi:hypothetical protein